MSCHIAQRDVNWHFLGVLQHDNKGTPDKQSGSKYFKTYCFINLLVNDLLHAAPYVIHQWRNVLEKILTTCTSNFRSVFTVIIEVKTTSSFNRAASCIAKLKSIWCSQPKGAIGTMSLALSQWFQTYLINRCCKMSKNCQIEFETCWVWSLTTVLHISEKVSLYFLTSKITTKIDLKFDVVEIFSRTLRHW